MTTFIEIAVFNLVCMIIVNFHFIDLIFMNRCCAKMENEAVYGKFLMIPLLIIRQKQTFNYTLSRNSSAVEYSLARFRFDYDYHYRYLSLTC